MVQRLIRRPMVVGFGLFLLSVLLHTLSASVGLRLILIQPGAITPIWPASGISLALLVLVPRRYWPWVLAGIAVAHIPENYSLPRRAMGITFYGLANTCESLLGALILTWGRTGKTGGPPRIVFDRIGDVFRLFLAAGPANALTACLAAVPLYLMDYIPNGFEFWRIWLVSDGVGILVMTPLILSARNFTWLRMPLQRKVGAVILLALSILCSVWVFRGKNGSGSILLDQPFVLTVPFLIWAGLRADVFITSVVALIFTGTAALATASGNGPFVPAGLPPSTDLQTLVALQIVLLAWTTCGLVVSVTTASHRAALKQLSEQEQAARANEQLFRAFIEDAPAPIMLVPGPDQSPVYFNPALTRVFGYTRTDIPRPSDWWALAYPDEKYRALRREAWAAVEEKARHTGAPQDADEGMMRARDGKTRFAQVRLAIVQGYKLIFINDLTAQRRTEAVLRLTQYAVDHNPVIIYRVDTEGRFVYVNESACEHFGYTRAELMSMRLWEVSRTLNAHTWPERSSQVRATGDTHFEALYVRKDGTEFPAEVRACFQEFDGAAYFFTFAFDITARKKAENAAQQHLQRIESLALELTRSEERQRRELASILHDEVGQNLFAATAQLLALRNTVPAAQPVTDRALALLDKIAHDTRNLTFELCPPVLYQIGLAPALQRLVDQFTTSYGIKFSLQRAEGPADGNGAGPKDLNVRGLAYQAVRELLNNAAKHSHAKNVTVSLAERNNRLHVEVADDGEGFDPEQLGRREAGASSQNGFGLFHLRERIGLLEGSLRITSCPGKGCRVELELPLGTIGPE